MNSKPSKRINKTNDASASLSRPLYVAVVTSIHEDFDKRVWRQCVALADRGIDVNVICPWIPRSDVPLPDRVRLVPFLRVSTRSLRIIAILRAFRALAPVLRQVDIVHFHDLDLLFPMAALSWFKPVVYDIHENYPEEMLTKAYVPKPFRRLLYHFVRIVETALARIVRNVVLVTPPQMKRFSSSAFNPLLLRNYASQSLVTHFTDNYLTRPKAIVFTGSHYEENGTMLLPEMMARLKPAFPDVRLIITDIFPYASFKTSFLQRLRQLNVETHVEIVKPVPAHEVWRICNRGIIGLSLQMNVLKQQLAIPTKLFEYMALGLPVVATSLPYVKDILERTNAGLLCRYDSEDLAAKVSMLLSDPQHGQLLGENGKRAFLSEFTWEREIDGLHAYYASLVSTRGPGTATYETVANPS